MVRVEPVEPRDEWDAFVESTPGAYLGHASPWADVLRDAYGLHPRYLACRDQAGTLQGVLPLVEMRTLTGRRELVSIPFHDVAGVLAPGEAAADALRREALVLARAHGCAALELRQAGAPPDPAGAPPSRANLVLALRADEEAQWKALPATVRNQVRKARKEGLALASWPPPALLDGFYACFKTNMRDLGSPVHARAFFAEAARRFGERLRFFVAADGARAVGGLVAIHYAGRVTVTWASTLRSERPRCPNNLIYWEALRWAVALGAREFDFGRSPVGAGTYRFKRGWGAEPQALEWTRLSTDGSQLPSSAAQESWLLSRLSALWRHLPVGLTAGLGPAIRRHLSQ